MYVTIKGRKKKPDVILTDDRLICGNEEFLYADIKRIWALSFLGASFDITYRGRHHGFKIEESEMEKATQAAAEVQKMIDARVDREIDMLAGVRDPDALFEFVKAHDLKEIGVGAGWFTDRMRAILGMLEPGEIVRLPFEAKCGLSIVVDTNKERFTSFQTKEAQFAGLVTDRRLILYTQGLTGSRSRILPLDKVWFMKVITSGMFSNVILLAQDPNDNTGLLGLNEIQAETIRRTIARRV